MKGIVESLVDKVYKHHNNDPKPLDLMKTAATTEGRVLTYNQSYRALSAPGQKRWENARDSFQMIQPYLDKLVELNPGSIASCETDAGYNMEQFFLCPGIMQRTLQYV